MHKRKFDVAILDDGVNSNVFRNCRVETSIVVQDGTIKSYSENEYITHGTVCASLICTSEDNFILHSIKVIEWKKYGNIERLIEGLVYCINHNYKIIHMSLGSVEESDCKILYPIISKAIRKKIIIVASVSNDNIITYPASFEKVIGVRFSLKGAYGIYKFKNNTLGKNIYGVNSNSTLYLKNGMPYDVGISNSFSTTHITKIIIRYLNEIDDPSTVDVNDIIKFLDSICINNF